jgi:hypothetical protein
LSSWKRNLLALVGVFCMGVNRTVAQTITLFPDQIPNGIAANSGDQYHQRLDITLTGSPIQQSRAFTITIPAELAVVANSVTTTTSGSNLRSFFAGTPASNRLAFGVTLVSGILSGSKVIVEFDLTTPTNYTGISNGSKVDTSYVVDFSPGSNLTDTNVPVAKHQNKPIRVVAFSAPDSAQGDTTTAGGRFYKLAFPSAGLPDPSHTGISGLSVSAGFGDTRTDVLYTFYLSQDSSLVRRPQNLDPVAFVSLMSDGGGGGPLLGTRQRERDIPNTFIRENFVTLFAAAGRDSVNGMISLGGTVDNAVYYVYALVDPAPGRNPSSTYTGAGSAKKGYDPTKRGTFSADFLIGRSGPLLIQHPPEFVVVGWDYDVDNGDEYDNTGIVQVPSDIIGMAEVNANRKDNRDITIDTGSYIAKGNAFNSVESGLTPNAISSLDLLFMAQDSDNPADFKMNIFLSTQSGLTLSEFVGASPSIDSLSGAIKVSGTDTLTINSRKLSFNPVVRDPTTNLVTSYIPEGSYSVYFSATDGVHRSLSQVVDDPFITAPTATQLSVRHSPELTADAFSLNDFDGTGDGDLDVITGIDVSQMQTDADGKDLSPGPAQRYVTISWGEQGLNGDLDIDDDATMGFYYSTRSDFRDSRGSVAYTSGNSDGSDLLNDITESRADTHEIGRVQEDPDGQFDNQLAWDLWTYLSPEGTVPRTGVRYYIYTLFFKGGVSERLISLTRSGTLSSAGTSMAINFQNPPFIRPLEPTRDISVTVDEPVLISWEAMDVDNEEASGLTAVPVGTSGRVEPNSRNDSPNVRVLLTSADFGEVTTWGSITSATQVHRFWVGNSGDGSLAEEIELNEGVDTSFVMIGNRMRNNLFSTPGLGGSSGTLELQTNGGVGQTYNVYLAIDDGRDGSVADAVTGNGIQQTNFGAFSPAVKAAGSITFIGTVPASPSTSTRFIMPSRLEVAAEEVLKFPIIPEVSPSGKQINVVDIFISVDADKFEALDQDASTAGTQPFTLGENSGINAANVQQSALVIDDRLLLDLIYTDVTNGLTFFDGRDVFAIANLRAKTITGSSTVVTQISLDNSGSRVTKMLDSNNVNAIATVPPPTDVVINRRSLVTGKVPLQGRDSSSTEVTFMLRQVGSYGTISDTQFELNDTDNTKFGIQVQTTDSDGKFLLQNIPSGRFILTASVPRHLTGHDTIDVKPGLDLNDLLPTRDGDGVQRAALLAGDAAGFVDSTGASIPDNAIGSPDINAINASIFLQASDTGYNTFADINQDSIVNATDKDYATANTTDNTGAAGNVRPVFPAFKQGLLQGSNEEARITLADYPKEVVQAGESFDVTLQVSGAHSVRTYEVHLSYDTTKLAVQSIVSSGSLLKDYLTDMVAKISEGEVGFANSILGRTPVGASGDGTLATIRFRAIARSVETRLALEDAILIDVDHVSVRPVVEGEAMILVSKDPIVYHDAEGKEIRGLILSDTDATVDFNDFVVLVKAFGSGLAEVDFDLRADLNADDRVDFADFVILSSDFGRVAVDAPASGRVNKPATSAGANSGAQLGFRLDEQPDQQIEMSIGLEGVSSLQGWGVTMKYDPDKYEFVEAKVPSRNFLEVDGGTAPLFLIHREGKDRITLAGAIGQGASVSGHGTIAGLTFKPIGEVEGAGFEITNATLFDSNMKTNLLRSANIAVKDDIASAFAWLKEVFIPLRSGTGLFSR